MLFDQLQQLAVVRQRNNVHLSAQVSCLKTTCDVPTRPASHRPVTGKQSHQTILKEQLTPRCPPMVVHTRTYWNAFTCHSVLFSRTTTSSPQITSAVVWLNKISNALWRLVIQTAIEPFRFLYLFICLSVYSGKWLLVTVVETILFTLYVLYSRGYENFLVKCMGL
jgi:hypothetical protein